MLATVRMSFVIDARSEVLCEETFRCDQFVRIAKHECRINGKLDRESNICHVLRWHWLQCVDKGREIGEWISSEGIDRRNDWWKAMDIGRSVSIRSIR